MAKQENLGLKIEQEIKSVEDYRFDPIKGYPMIHWKGKRPFAGTTFYPAQLKENHGTEVNGWMNKIFWGDNLQVMSHLLKMFRGQIDLVYIDPPFDSKADYKKKIELRGKQITNETTAFEEKQYSDIWTNDEYLQFMYERLILIRELLADTGSIFLHCDWNKSHHLRCLLDEIFGPSNFRNEIYWHYYNKMPDTRKSAFPRSTDTILWYAKNKEKAKEKFTPLTEKRDKPVKQLVRKKVNGKMVNARDEKGNVMYRDSETKVIDNIWRLPMLQPADQTENLRYPTQKPETILERIIAASTREGDLVFDCFMGSGTTQAVAMRTGRKFIGADINLGAVQITTKRLLNLAKELNSELVSEIRYTSFSVFNVNHYDVFRNPTQAKDILIRALEIQPLPNNDIFDGEKDGRMVKVMPINRIATRADLNELITNFDYKAFEKANEKNPGKPVENLLLICMGHEPDLAAFLQSAVPYKLDIEVVDILRDSSKLEFKRDAEAEIVIEGGNLVIREFYPMNLLQKLSLMKENVVNWKELTDSVMIDFNYDGAIFEPQIVDIPNDSDFVKGIYEIPKNAGTIRVKITDLLSESLEKTISE